MGFRVFADTPNFPSPLVEFKDVGGERALICPICCLGTAHPPSKTPPLSLCLSGSGTVMLILGLMVPSKLRGLHY